MPKIDKPRSVKLIIYAAMTVFCMAAIFFFSAQDADASQGLSDGLLQKVKMLLALLPSITGQGAEHDIRKYAHLFEYFMLGLSSALFVGKLIADKQSRQLTAFLCAWVFCALYACTDEVHQYFVPGRSAQLSDVMIDSCGAVVGVAIVCIIRAVRYKKRGKRNGKASS